MDYIRDAPNIETLSLKKVVVLIVFLFVIVI